MIAIIDYESGNVLSVKNALKRLQCEYFVTQDPDELSAADGVVFPGQGRVGQSMEALRATGMDKAIPQITKPFLGICVGMQLLGRYSEEDEINCLGVFDYECRKFPPNLKTPHLGWNRVNLVRDSKLFNGIASGAYFYFLHSYYIDGDGDEVVCLTNYGFQFASAMRKNNFFSTQFHVEKSGDVGERVLMNFLEICS